MSSTYYPRPCLSRGRRQYIGIALSTLKLITFAIGRKTRSNAIEIPLRLASRFKTHHKSYT